jgi:hypothetical protein
MAGLVLQSIAGGVGGSVVGTTVKRYDLGIIGNLLVGILGGGIGAQIIGALVGDGEASAIVGPDGFDLAGWSLNLLPVHLVAARWSWSRALLKKTSAARSPPDMRLGSLESTPATNGSQLIVHHQAAPDNQCHVYPARLTAPRLVGCRQPR